MLNYHFGYGKYAPSRPGKRVRPQMLLRVALGGGAPLEAALDAAVAIEILHNYSLVHDDIEDRDELRRGRPTLWSSYGIPHAINTGDAMCALSFLSLTRAAAQHDAVRALHMVAILHEAHLAMCDGQALDLEFEVAAHVKMDEYHRMIAGKTGAIFEAACTLGAQSAACAGDDITAYATLGRAYGRAFQIHDDRLGIWGSADATGKVPGNDLARRKWSFPVVWALAQPDSFAQRVVVKAYARVCPLDPTEVAEVVAALDELGARAACDGAMGESLTVLERHPNIALGQYLLGTLAE